MATINSVGNALTGSTGTGTFVGANTPTLITPVLGAATATSINFGGSTLSTYTQSTSFSPVVTFATIGDLSVSYALQGGYYSRVGNIVQFQFVLQFTPTYTTASGQLRISLPFTCLNQGLAVPVGNMYVQGVTFPAGTTCVALQGVSNQSYLIVYSSGSAVGAANWSSVTIPTAVAVTMAGTLTFLV